MNDKKNKGRQSISTSSFINSKMKYLLNLNKLRIVFAFLIIILPFADLYCMQTKAGDTIIIPSDEIINEHLFFACESFEFNGSITGDIVGACRDAKIAGEVKGDLWIAAQTVEIMADIQGSAIIAAQQISVSGNCSGDILGICEDFQLEKSSKVQGKVYFYCQDMEIDGPVLSDVTGASETLRINSNIDGNVDVCIQKLDMGTDGKIKGSLNYNCPKEVTTEDKIKIFGKIFHQLPEIAKEKEAKGFGFFKIIHLIGYFVLGLIILLPLKNHTALVTSHLRKNLWFCLSIGFISFVIIPILILILCVTIIGIPIAILLTVIFSIIWYLSSLFVMTCAGESIIVLFKKDKPGSILLSFVVGMVILELLKLIPIVGTIVQFFVWFVGVGVLLITRKVLFVELKEKGII